MRLATRLGVGRRRWSRASWGSRESMVFCSAGESRTVGVVDNMNLQSMHSRRPEAIGMRLSRQRAAELSRSHRRQRDQDPAAVPSSHRDWVPNLLCWDERTGDMSSQVQPTNPFIRARDMHLHLREECCEIARVWLRCARGCLAASVFCRPIAPPLPTLSAEGGVATKRRSQPASCRHVSGGGPFQDYASPHPFPIHFRSLICLSSLFPSC
jgi:hypothetical protein